MRAQRPKILQIGAGRFGRQHLDEWIRLQSGGHVEIVGVVVRNVDTRAALASTHDVPLFEQLSEDLLRAADAVDIVTTPDSHAELVSACLPFAHVLVEKPLATSAAEAGRLSALAASHEHVLMVGHIFRFHPVVQELKRMVAAIPELPRGITAVMINPASHASGRADVGLEMLHPFDIVDFLFDVEPEIVEGRRRGELDHVSVRYPGPITARVRIGWQGMQKIRTLELSYTERRIAVDLIDNSIIESTRNNQLHKRFFEAEPSPLAQELRHFLSTIAGQTELAQCDATVGARIVHIGTSAHPATLTKRPRIAVVGGGIFGATCAIELATVGDVTLYERHGSLLTETSTSNQRRHHSGFHYPRSYDTIDEIRAARAAFEVEYGEAIDKSFPAYYCTSATGVEIPADRYLAACQSNHLDFSLVSPPRTVVDPTSVSLCVLTDEGIYDPTRLTDIVNARIAASPHIACKVQHTVIAGALASDGTKQLTVNGPGGTSVEGFDYVINATYSGRNLMAQWFGFPVEPLRFDLFEILQLRLPIPQISVTILDGPFTTLTGTGQEDIFFLSHIHDSVSRSVIPDDGMPPTWAGLTSNRTNMLRHSARYLPVLQHATDVQSWWMTRAVNAFARDFDARPTVITDHGFGCWSVLGGKIVTSVVNAREIAGAISTECRQHDR